MHSSGFCCTLAAQHHSPTHEVPCRPRTVATHLAAARTVLTHWTLAATPPLTAAPTVLTLQDQEYSNLSRGRLNATELDRPAIAVCHSFPDCWRMQNDIASMVTGCPCPMENDKASGQSVDTESVRPTLRPLVTFNLTFGLMLLTRLHTA